MYVRQIINNWQFFCCTCKYFISIMYFSHEIKEKFIQSLKVGWKDVRNKKILKTKNTTKRQWILHILECFSFSRDINPSAPLCQKAKNNTKNKFILSKWTINYINKI